VSQDDYCKMAKTPRANGTRPKAEFNGMTRRGRRSGFSGWRPLSECRWSSPSTGDVSLHRLEILPGAGILTFPKTRLAYEESSTRRCSSTTPYLLRNGGAG